MTFGYDSSLAFSGNPATLSDYACDLLERIRVARLSEREKGRPILFVCHSLGGIICKKALVAAHENPAYTPLLERIKGITFMGTPHRGSGFSSLGNPLSNIVKLAFLGDGIGSDLLGIIEHSFPALNELSKAALYRLAPLQIVSFYEQKITIPLGRVVSTAHPFVALHP